MTCWYTVASLGDFEYAGCGLESLTAPRAAWTVSAFNAASPVRKHLLALGYDRSSREKSFESSKDRSASILGFRDTSNNQQLVPYPYLSVVDLTFQ